MVPRWFQHVRTKYRLVWHIYRSKAIIFLLCKGSDAHFRLILHYLAYCQTCSMGLWKAEHHNCSNAALGSTVVALLAITSFLLPLADQIHWTARALWVASILCAFMAIAFSCKHQRFLGNLLVERPDDTWAWKGWFQCGEKTDKPKPRLDVIFLLSATKMFLDWSLITYVIGLGIYLGKIWISQRGADTGTRDSLNIFIVFLVFGTAFVGILTIVDGIPHEREAKSWADFLDRYSRDNQARFRGGNARGGDARGAGATGGNAYGGDFEDTGSNDLEATGWGGSGGNAVGSNTLADNRGAALKQAEAHEDLSPPEESFKICGFKDDEEWVT